MNPIVLQNENLRMEFNRDNGALVSFTCLQTGWKLLDRPELGLSFRLLVPLAENRRNNPVFGEKQSLTRVEVDPDGRCAVFGWDGVTSEFGGLLDIRLTLQVTLDNVQAVFAMTIENHSSYVIENVYCPYLGDIRRPKDAKWLKTFLWFYADATEWNLWPKYDNLRGYFGVDYPTQFASWNPGCGAPMVPFILVRDENQGLYVGASVPNSSELVAWHTELRPGYDSSIDNHVPEEDEISGVKVATRFAAVHLPFIMPGETRALVPIALQPFQGSWHHGVDIYKHWRSNWFKPVDLPEWAQDPHSWQQIHINSPEDELRLRFTELPKVGEECARHGVKAIQLVGWNEGGQDQGNPSHNPDSRLGTWDELKNAIEKIQSMGVKVILFSKFTWADRDTDRFRSELIRMAVKDPFGGYYMHGWHYQTATQLLDINATRLIPMCFLDDAYLDVCNREFQKTVDLGADGILYDENLHHGPSLLCFDLNHGHRYGALVFANDRKLIRNFRKISDSVRPDFLFAGEGNYDWENEIYQFSYFRSWNKQHIPLHRYILPHFQFMTAITGFNDRNMVNQCLLYRYTISYEPYNFKGHLDDFPLTMAYGKQMDALRTELRDYFWDGEFQDTLGATVLNEGKPHHPYTVYRNTHTGRAGLVIANYEKDAASVQPSLNDGTLLKRWRIVEDPTWHNYDGEITIPARSAVVVL